MKLNNNWIGKLLLAVLMLTASSVVNGEVFWDFQLGGNYRSFTPKYVDYDGEIKSAETSDKQNSYELMTGFGLYIPLGKTSPWIIETGLRYRYALIYPCFENEAYTYWNGTDTPTYANIKYTLADYGHGHTLEIPLKLNYEWKWSSKNSLRFGLGAYGSYLLTGQITGQCDSYDMGGSFVVGIEPSITYSHRCVSFGFHYHNPLFYEQFDNLLGSAFTFTFALKFKSSAWKYIGLGVATAATVGAGVAALYESTNGGGNNQDNSGSYSSGSSSSSSSKSEGNKYSISEQQSYNADKSTYAKYDSMLSQVFAGNREASSSEIKDWQSKMKKLRTKWEAKGKSFPKSSNESR